MSIHTPRDVLYAPNYIAHRDGRHEIACQHLPDLLLQVYHGKKTEGVHDARKTRVSRNQGSYFWLTLWTRFLTAITLSLYWPAAYAAQQPIDCQEHTHRWEAIGVHMNGNGHLFVVAEDTYPVDHHHWHIRTLGMVRHQAVAT